MGKYDQTLGLFLVGIFFNTYLYGIVTYQCCTYFTAKFEDRWLVKAMIAFMFLLASFEAIGLIYNVWNWTVTNFANPDVLAGDEWPYSTVPFSIGTSAIFTQLFLAWRIWRLSGSRLLPAIASMLAVTAWVFCLVTGIKATMIKRTKQMTVITGYVATWMVTQVITDLFIATTLIVFLVRSKSEVAKSHNNANIFNRLVGAAVQTGSLAGVFSILGLTFFLLWPTSRFQSIFVPPIGGIYSITLLDTLLARLDVRNPRRINPACHSMQGPESTSDPYQLTTVITINDFTMQASGGPTSETDNVEPQFSSQGAGVNTTLH